MAWTDGLQPVDVSFLHNCIICSTCEVFVLLIKPIVFLTFCSPSRRSILSPQVFLVETALAFLRLVFTRDGVEYEIVVAVMSLWKSKIGVVTEVTSATESRSEENKFPSDSAYDCFRRVRSSENQIDEFWKQKGPGGGRGELLGSIFAGYVPLAS